MYNFSGDVSLSRNSINFDNIRATDEKENTARARGKILHENFNQMKIDLSVDFQNFQVLNTNAKDNNLFYGEGYASGNVRFSGPLNNMLITSTARSEKNTRIFIPIQGTSSVEKKDFINFVNFSDSTFSASLANNIVTRTKLTGITLDLNIDVTPDAYCEIIFDIKAGDIIRGRGDGDIKLQLDTKGEFNMFGYIDFQEGGYNFTLYDIINKEFSINKGSRITWFGDPYAATLNITASYNQIASLAPILADPELAYVTQIRRKYPVQVLLKLDGAMLSPVINFDIVANDLPKSIPVEGKAPVRLDFEFAAFKNRLDEQELKRQVFSLIILRRFSPPESFNTSGSLVNSVSELFSNQLSYWASQVDENLEIDVDLGTLDQEAFNTFQLRLSYSFFNGRLRVTRDGALNSNPQQANSTTPTDQRSSLSGVVGDWTVDYLLTVDGKFKVRMYSRTNVNPLYTSVGTQNAVTTGVSLTHTQSFNQVKDLWQSARKNKRKEETELQNNKEAIKEEDGSN
jgi:hypothetical protein